MSEYSLSLPAAEPLLTLTRPKPHLWVIELHNGDDSRLTDTLIDGAFKPALDEVEAQWNSARESAKKSKSKDKFAGAGALVIVGNRKQDKFFSNGLDLQRAMAHRAFFPEVFDPLLHRLLSFPSASSPLASPLNLTQSNTTHPPSTHHRRNKRPRFRRRLHALSCV